MADSTWFVDDRAAAQSALENALASHAQHGRIKTGRIQSVSTKPSFPRRRESSPLNFHGFRLRGSGEASKRVSTEQGLSDCLSPKACLRQAYAAGWIDDEATWLEMPDAQHRMTHTYDARRALVIYESLPRYRTSLGKLLAALQALPKP